MTRRKFTSVWDAIEEPGHTASLRARSELMIALSALIRGNGWTQRQAAAHLGIPAAHLRPDARPHRPVLARHAGGHGRRRRAQPKITVRRAE